MKQMGLFEDECIEGDLIVAGASILVAIIGMYVYNSHFSKSSLKCISYGNCRCTCHCETEEEEHRDEDTAHVIEVHRLEKEALIAQHEKVIAERDATIRSKNAIIVTLRRVIRELRANPNPENHGGRNGDRHA